MVTRDIKGAVCGLQVTTYCAERNNTDNSGINLMWWCRWFYYYCWYFFKTCKQSDIIIEKELVSLNMGTHGR